MTCTHPHFRQAEDQPEHISRVHQSVLVCINCGAPRIVRDGPHYWLELSGVKSRCKATRRRLAAPASPPAP